MPVRAIVLLAAVFAGMASIPAAAQNIGDTVDSLESAAGELQDAADDLEQFRGAADEDLTGATRAVKNARQTMRSIAITLLLASVSPNRPKEFERTMT